MLRTTAIASVFLGALGVATVPANAQALESGVARQVEEIFVPDLQKQFQKDKGKVRLLMVFAPS